MFDRITSHNTHLTQWGLTSYNQKSGYYYRFVLADSSVFQNPPLRQAWERCTKAWPKTVSFKLPAVLGWLGLNNE